MTTNHPDLDVSAPLTSFHLRGPLGAIVAHVVVAHAPGKYLIVDVIDVEDRWPVRRAITFPGGGRGPREELAVGTARMVSADFRAEPVELPWREVTEETVASWCEAHDDRSSEGWLAALVRGEVTLGQLRAAIMRGGAL